MIRRFPPDAASNHWYVPPGETAVRVAELPKQTVVPGAIGADGGDATVTVTVVLGPGQPLMLLSTK